MRLITLYSLDSKSFVVLLCLVWYCASLRTGRGVVVAFRSPWYRPCSVVQ